MPEDREFDPSSGASEKPGMQPSLNRQFLTVNEKKTHNYSIYVGI